MRRVRAVSNGTPDSVEDDLAVMPRRVRQSLLNQLAEGERIIIRTRQSPQVLLPDAVWPALALAFWIFLVVEVGASPKLTDIVFVALLVALARVGWKEAQRRYSWFVATNKRVLKHRGIIIHKVPMMLLRKVTDMTYSRSVLGQIGNYGTIVFESAGQKQAIRELTYIPEPDAVAQALNAEIFGDRPRAKRQDERGWARRTKRPWRGDDGSDDGPRGGGPSGDGPRGGGDGGPRRGPEPTAPGTGGVDVSPAGHPSPPPPTEPETWYRSSNLRGPSRLGDTGEIPAVSAEEAEAWLEARREQQRQAGRDRHDRWEDEQDAREIPLYPPREWVDRD